MLEIAALAERLSDWAEKLRDPLHQDRQFFGCVPKLAFLSKSPPLRSPRDFLRVFHI